LENINNIIRAVPQGETISFYFGKTQEDADPEGKLKR
jgi:hypothetical protein